MLQFQIKEQNKLKNGAKRKNYNLEKILSCLSYTN